jgi:hypothetical protein
MSKRGARFTEKEKLAILKEGEKNGVKAVCAKTGWQIQHAGETLYCPTGDPRWNLANLSSL